MKYKRLSNFKPIRKKSTNKFKHKWIDEGKEKDGNNTYIYRCDKCGNRKIKQSAYTSIYYNSKMVEIGRTSPECSF